MSPQTKATRAESACQSRGHCTHHADKETEARRGDVALLVSHGGGPDHLTSRIPLFQSKSAGSSWCRQGRQAFWPCVRLTGAKRPAEETLEDLGPVLGVRA